jgi:Ca2+-binding RTX toxin-like protein
VLTFSGSAAIADYEAVLRSLSYTNSSQRPDVRSRSISVSVDDGEPAENLASATYAIHIVAANDAPGFADDAFLPAILQETVDPLGQTVNSLFRGLLDDPDADAALRGVGVVANTASAAAQGRWQYSTDAGATWFDIGIVADGPNALALAAAARLRFLPVAAFVGQPDTLGVRAIDDTYTGSFTSGAIRQTVDTTVNGATTPLAAATNDVATTIFPTGTAGNTPPTLLDVPVSAHVDEGQTFAFDADASDPDSGQALTFSLLGAPGTATIDPDTGAFAWTTTEADGPDTFVFNVRVSDGFATTEKTVTVIVGELNAAPVLANVPAAVTMVRGNAFEFTATATDTDSVHGQGNALTFRLDGESTGMTVVSTTGKVRIYLPDDIRPGETISGTIRVTDDGVPAKSDSKPITITVADYAVIGGDLVVGGTEGNDTIAVKPSRDATKIVVTMNRQVIAAVAQAAVTGRIVIRGLDGNDRITIAPKIAIPTELVGGYGNDVLIGGKGHDWLLGDAGNDRIVGGQGNDVLVGGAGDDTLTDAAGTNVLLGGAGADRLVGGVGDDLLIGGAYKAEVVPWLWSIALEWTSGSSYTDRVNHLTNGGGLNGTELLTAATVDDDLVRDVLVGGRGIDYFVSSTLDQLDLHSATEVAMTV